MIHRYRATIAALFRKQAIARLIMTTLEHIDLQGKQADETQKYSKVIVEAMVLGYGVVVEVVVEVEAVASLKGTTLAGEVGVWTVGEAAAGTPSSKEEDTNQCNGMNAVAATTEDTAASFMLTEGEIHEMNHAWAQVAILVVALAKIHDRNNIASPVSETALQNKAVAVAAAVTIDTDHRSTTRDHRNVRMIETAAASATVTVTSSPGTTMEAVTAATTILPRSTAVKTRTATENVVIITTKIVPTVVVRIITKKNAFDKRLIAVARAMTLVSKNMDILQKVGNATMTASSLSNRTSRQ